MESGITSMNAPLNFGPSEQTREQRQQIADRARALLDEEEQHMHEELNALYERYIAGEADLYAISVLVSEQARQRLQALVPPTTDQP